MNNLNTNKPENSFSGNASKLLMMVNNGLIKDENGKILEIKNIFQSVINKEKLKSIEPKFYYVDSDIVFEHMKEIFIDLPLDINTYETLCMLALSIVDAELNNADFNWYLSLWLESYSYLNSYIKESNHEFLSSCIADKFITKYRQVERKVIHHSLIRLLNGILNNKSN